MELVVGAWAALVLEGGGGAGSRRVGVSRREGGGGAGTRRIGVGSRRKDGGGAGSRCESRRGAGGRVGSRCRLASFVLFERSR